MSEVMQSDPVARMLIATPQTERDSLGRQRWMLTWLDDGEHRGQGWFGTLDELSAMAARNGFGGVEVWP